VEKKNLKKKKKIADRSKQQPLSAGQREATTRKNRQRKRGQTRPRETLAQHRKWLPRERKKERRGRGVTGGGRERDAVNSQNLQITAL